jgi:hypothetical protein
MVAVKETVTESAAFLKTNYTIYYPERGTIFPGP